MGLADFFLYGGSSGGGGGGSSLPSNWDVESNSLTIKGEGLNSLGWRCSNKDYYFEKSFEWDVTYDVSDLPQTDTYEKVENVPGFVYRCHSELTPQVYWYEGLSTSADGALLECGSQEVTTSSFTYNDTTWYLCKSYSYDNLDSDKINTAGYSLKLTDDPEAIAKYIIDASEISFTASNDFTQLASPDKDYTIAAGGSASDFSDATFRVNSSGDVFGGNFYSNGVAISSAFTGATSSSAGAQGMVPAPSSADVNKFLKGNGTWAEAGTPGNWNINPTSLVMQDTGKEVNSLGWYCGNKENYYEEAKTWSIYQVGSQYHEFSKSNNKPALLAAVKQIGSTWVHSICVSTVADATHFTQNSQDNEFEYLGETWYWSGGEYSLPEGDYTVTVSGINRLPDDTFVTMLDAAKFLIDQGLVSFNSGKKTILSDPSQEHIILGGGIQDDGSDATFKVSNAGVIEANGMVVNGVAVTSAFTGATSSAAGSVGLVPAPGISDREKILKGDGTWMAQKPSPVDYKNMEEQPTGIRWIDGFEIYQYTRVYDNVSMTSDSNPGILDNFSSFNIMNMVDIKVNSVTTGGGIIFNNFQLDNSYKFHIIWYPSNSELNYRANWGSSGTFTVTVTYYYTKAPDENDLINAYGMYSGYGDGYGSHAFYDYQKSMWRGPSFLFLNDSSTAGHISRNPTDSGGTTVWSTYSTQTSGGDPVVEDETTWHWISWDATKQPSITNPNYIPYCVAIAANAYYSVSGGTYPHMKIDFSSDGTNWDTLWTGIPTIPAGEYAYFPISTNNTYSKIRLMFDNGTGVDGNEWLGCLGFCKVYGKR